MQKICTRLHIFQVLQERPPPPRAEVSIPAPAVQMSKRRAGTG